MLPVRLGLPFGSPFFIFNDIFFVIYQKKKKEYLYHTTRFSHVDRCSFVFIYAKLAKCLFVMYSCCFRDIG